MAKWYTRGDITTQIEGYESRRMHLKRGDRGGSSRRSSASPFCSPTRSADSNLLDVSIERKEEEELRLVGFPNPLSLSLSSGLQLPSYSLRSDSNSNSNSSAIDSFLRPLKWASRGNRLLPHTATTDTCASLTRSSENTRRQHFQSTKINYRLRES